MLGFRLRLISVVLALIGTGLLVSLLPTTDFTIRKTADPVKYAALTPVFPGSGVRQDLGVIVSPVVEARIWAAARLGFAPVRINVSLLVSGSNSPVRQFALYVAPAVEPQPQTVQFTSYKPPSDRRLTLQLAVVEDAPTFVTIGITRSTGDLALPTLNEDFIDAIGPVAHELTGRERGFHAALHGVGPEIVRLAGAGAAFALAIGTITLGSAAARAYRTLARPIRRRIAQVMAKESRGWHVYPWFLTLYPVLLLYSNGKNLHLFQLTDVLIVAGVALAAVTAGVLALWVLLWDIGRAAAVPTVLSIAILFYGHIFEAFGNPGAHRVLLPITAVAALGVCFILISAPAIARLARRPLNYFSVVLCGIPLVLLIMGAAGTAGAESPPVDPLLEPELQALIINRESQAQEPRPHIYYIVLDKYPRSDWLLRYANLDNSEFEKALEMRGFIVDRSAHSSYDTTLPSLGSALNMRYLEESELEFDPTYRLIYRHLVGSVLANLGYTYVHVSSARRETSANYYAELVVDFTAEGVVTGSDVSSTSLGRFLPVFLRTTALRPFLPAYFAPASSHTPYPWWHPLRTLATFEYIGDSAAGVTKPVFLFAHILKPHEPNSFDRHGNILPRPFGWSPEDRADDLPGFIEQLLYTNTLVLEAVDEILANSETPPVIVIQGDHGFGDPDRRAILSAYHVPDSCGDTSYSGLTSANSFRVIFNACFGANLELWENR